jgi:hypothetical protein
LGFHRLIVAYPPKPLRMRQGVYDRIARLMAAERIADRVADERMLAWVAKLTGT